MKRSLIIARLRRRWRRFNRTHSKFYFFSYPIRDDLRARAMQQAARLMRLGYKVSFGPAPKTICPVCGWKQSPPATSLLPPIL